MPEKIFEALNEASGVYFTGTLVESRRTPFQLLEVFETRLAPARLLLLIVPDEIAGLQHVIDLLVERQ